MKGIRHTQITKRDTPFPRLKFNTSLINISLIIVLVCTESTWEMGNERFYLD